VYPTLLDLRKPRSGETGGARWAHPQTGWEETRVHTHQRSMCIRQPSCSSTSRAIRRTRPAARAHAHAVPMCSHRSCWRWRDWGCSRGRGCCPLIAEWARTQWEEGVRSPSTSERHWAVSLCICRCDARLAKQGRAAGTTGRGREIGIR
jgi:hypothetical protein